VLPLERKGRKSVAWSRSGVKSVIGNRVYRGELRDGDELVCKQAHQPLVSEGEWKLAQLGGIGPLYVKDGSIAAQGLLTSLVFCAACGHRLSLTGSTAKNGERVASYFCRIHHAGNGDCPEPAVASTRTLDPYVEGLLLEALADPASKLVKAHEVGARIEGTAELMKRAEAKLDTFLATELASVLGPDRYRAEVERRQDAVRTALREFDDAMRANLTLGQEKSRTEAARDRVADVDDGRETRRRPRLRRARDRRQGPSETAPLAADLGASRGLLERAAWLAIRARLAQPDTDQDLSRTPAASRPRGRGRAPARARSLALSTPPVSRPGHRRRPRCDRRHSPARSCCGRRG